MFYGALKHDNDRFKLPTNTESTWHISTHILTHSQNNNAEIASTHRSPFSQSTHKKNVYIFHNCLYNVQNCKFQLYLTLMKK